MPIYNGESSSYFLSYSAYSWILSTGDVSVRLMLVIRTVLVASSSGALTITHCVHTAWNQPSHSTRNKTLCPFHHCFVYWSRRRAKRLRNEPSLTKKNQELLSHLTSNKTNRNILQPNPMNRLRIKNVNNHVYNR